MNDSTLKRNLIIQSLISILCLIIIFIGDNKILEDQYPNWIMMLWVLTLISPLAYLYYVKSGNSETFKNAFGVSFSFQVILFVIHILFYNHYSSLRGDAIFGGCYDCKPNYNFWVSSLGNVILLLFTFKWKKLDLIEDTNAVSNENNESKE